MTLAFAAALVGLALLAWSADRFVEGAASVARHLGAPPLLIGMVIVGFGTSAPEMAVSALAALQENPGIALGNAYGSNIANIALILGLTALLSPLVVHSQALRLELPMLAAATALAAWQLWDEKITRLEAVILLAVFAGLMAWTIRRGLREKTDALGDEMGREEMDVEVMPLRRAMFWLAAGLILLVAASRLLVWGAVEIAQGFGVSDLIIGLTIVAIGTSLPELASALAAARKGRHDIALGNILGSNLFNTLAVVGIAGAIHPMRVEPEVFNRDLPVMTALTLLLFAIGFGFRGTGGRINRVEGAMLLACYAGYMIFLVATAFGGRG